MSGDRLEAREDHGVLGEGVGAAAGRWVDGYDAGPTAVEAPMLGTERVIVVPVEGSIRTVAGLPVAVLVATGEPAGSMMW